MTRTSLLALTLLGFGLSAAQAGPMHGGCDEWGCGLNGASLNGTSFNGSSYQGVLVSGIQLQEWAPRAADRTPVVSEIVLPTGEVIALR